jgi:hypothetical protein
MPRQSKNEPSLGQTFLVHQPTNSVGLLIQAGMVDGEPQRTIELAGCELITAATKEFRLATGPEIERHHRAAAMVRPIALPTFLNSDLFTHSSRPASRPGL